jgi:hypothetical protein
MSVAATVPYDCPNCNTLKTGKFCSNCGQKEDARYTLHSLLHEVIHSITHADKGIFSYAWQLFYKPGIIARDLIEGKRKRYFNPFQYLLLIMAAMVILYGYTNFYEKMSASTSGMQTDETSKLISQKISDFLGKYQKLFYMILIPLFALFQQWFFKKDKFNYAEHMLGAVVMNGMSINYSIIFAILLYFIPLHPSVYYAVNLVFGLSVQVFFLKQFYKEKLWITTLKAIGMYIGYILIFSIITMIIGVIYFLVTKK